MNNATLIGIVLGVVLTLSAGWMVADKVQSLGDKIDTHNSALLEVLQ
jgi:heme/copper-type cytochrome/quinol oxidase subunit 4